MHKHFSLTRDRIRQFVDFQLRERLYAAHTLAEAEFLKGEFPDEAAARAADGWKSVEPGFSWGPAYAEGWYWVKGRVPAEYVGQTVVLTWGSEPQIKWEEWSGLIEGTFWQGNTQIGGLDYGHLYFRLPEGAESVDLLFQTYAGNRETTVHRPEKPRTAEPAEYKGFRFAVLDEERLRLFYDCEFALDLMLSYPEEDPLAVTLLRALNEVCNVFQDGKPASYAKGRKILKDAMDSVNVELKHTVVPVGHAHLDTAWLWPLSVTRLKMAHTTAVQLDLGERYGEHVFAHSQASQYEWIETAHPVLYERVKAAIKRGNWEPVGSMWVEADCNLTGGESLVRQFLYGRRYFEQKLGVVTEDMWLPDVFGYSAAIPQILTKFGITTFLTQKMSWNQTNKIPHNTFFWQGIDGSKVWTHFPPADTYNANCSPSEIVGSVKKHRDKGRSDTSLLLYGFGDGGGGATEWHLERLRRARTAPGMPVVETRVKAREFFARAREESRDLETWVGELYFEMHRGTYTSQAANKRGNRVSEFLMRDAEWLSCFRDDFATAYPGAELERLWKLVLLNQFHDIIPGSSVREVYEDSDRDYAEILAGGTKLVEEAMLRIAGQLDTSEMSHPLAIFHNADLTSEASMPWSEAAVPSSVVCGGESSPVQLVEAFGERRLVFAVPMAAQGTVAVADLSEQAAVSDRRLKVSGRKLENDEFSVRFDSHGNITSIVSLDDEPVEFVRPGMLANLFQLLDDRPLFWDAWDTDVFAQETAVDLVKSDSFEVVEKGPVRVAVELVKTFGGSTIRQRISLGPTPGIRFDTWVDWQEDHKFLKAAFPINANATRASFEIQFGHVERATHRNTSWDLARFEVCAQKWADVSEGGHGVALINTGKYGYDVHGSTLRLSLLRSPKAPDPICDRGEHRFSYVLMPHYDQVPHSLVVQAAYAVNAHPHVVRLEPSAGEGVELPALLHVDTRNVVIEAVKKAEDSGHRVVRLYECHNTRGRASLAGAMPIKRAWLCDLNENRLNELDVADGSVRFDYGPFEIVTLMVEM